MKAITRLLPILVLGYFASGCWFDFGFSGFKIKTTVITAPSPTQRSVEVPDPFVLVSGQWLGDIYSSATGSQFALNPTYTDGEGKLHVSNGRIMALWTFHREGGHCGSLDFVRQVLDNQTHILQCDLRGARFTASPDSFDLNYPPASMTLIGADLNTQYGMPTVEYYDEYGTFIGQTTAAAVAGDGSWLQCAMPNLAGVYTGVYTMVITNASADGSRNVVGTAVVWAYGNDLPPPPPDPDPDPCNPSYGNLPAIECVPVVY